MAREFEFCTWVGHAKSLSCDEWVFPKWAWSRSHEQFLHCGLRKFCHSKYTGDIQNSTVVGLFMTPIRQWVHVFITHCLQLNLDLHNFNLFRTCHTSNFCTVAWQLARFQLTWRIAQSLGDSWASCCLCCCIHFLPCFGTIGLVSASRLQKLAPLLEKVNGEEQAKLSQNGR